MNPFHPVHVTEPSTFLFWTIALIVLGVLVPLTIKSFRDGT